MIGGGVLFNLPSYTWFLEKYSLFDMPKANAVGLVPRGGIEPPTQGFSVPCSTD